MLWRLSGLRHGLTGGGGDTGRHVDWRVRGSPLNLTYLTAFPHFTTHRNDLSRSWGADVWRSRYLFQRHKIIEESPA